MRNIRLSLFILVMVVFWTLWLPEPKAALDFSYWYPEELEAMFTAPQLWRDFLRADGLGQDLTYIAWSWPLTWFWGLLAKIGLSFSLISRLFAFIPICLLGIFSIFRVFRFFSLSGPGRLAGGLFFLINTYILLLIDGGQIFLALAYVLLPLAFIYLLESIENYSLRKCLKATLSVLVLSVFDIRILFLLFLLTTLYLLFQANSRNVFRVLSRAFGLVIINVLALLSFHAYWLWPLLMSKSQAVNFTAANQANLFSFATIGHALFLLQPHWYLNVFGKITILRPEFIFAPLLVFLAPVINHKNKSIVFWAGIALLTVFLSKGTQEPFGNIYQWLFNFVPGFNLFRDPTKFMFLQALSYSVLITYSLEKIIQNITKKNLARLFLASIMILMITAIAPVWTGKMTGTFSTPVYISEHAALEKVLDSDKQFGRVLWLPNNTPLGFASLDHPVLQGYLVSQKRPFTSGIVGSYETANYLTEASSAGQLLAVAGVKYIVFPYPDERRELLKPDNKKYYQKFLTNLATKEWAKPIATESALPLIQVKNSSNQIFIPNNTYFVIGSDDLYRELEVKAVKLPNNALIFSEDKPELMRRISDFPQAKIILNNKSKLDLMLSLAASKDMIFPALELSYDPEADGWWKRDSVDLMNWRSFLQEKYSIDNLDFDYSGGWAVSEGENTRQIVDGRLEAGRKLFARVMTSSLGGELVFSQGSEYIGRVDTLDKSLNKVQLKEPEYINKKLVNYTYEKSQIIWKEVGTLRNNQPLSISTTGTINVINALAVLDDQILQSLKADTELLATKHGVVLWPEFVPDTSLSITQASFEKISPTKYKLNLKDVSAPQTVILSQSYSPNWQLQELGQRSVPTYSLLNAFSIPGNGEFTIEYKPQRYVYQGMWLNILTVITLLTLGLYSFFRKI